MVSVLDRLWRPVFSCLRDEGDVIYVGVWVAGCILSML